MAASGLLWKFKTNRPLTDFEREHQLKQKEHLDVEPIDQLSVIKASSTYLEVVDKYYATKGDKSMWGVVIFTLFLGVYIWFISLIMNSKTMDWVDGLIFFFMMSPIFAMVLWGFFKESFAYTHYPVRFNRKTRMVHIFMVGGRQLSVPWDEVFFHLGAGEKGEKGWWDLRGHILDKDDETVLETFAMMKSALGDENLEVMKGEWEFVRRYMEEDHVAMINKIQNCMPIDGKYETWNTAWNALMTNISGEAPAAYAFLRLFMALVFSIQLPFRMLAMHTSKLPLWNKEIEAANIIEVDDPYIKDSRINPEGLR